MPHVPIDEPGRSAPRREASPFARKGAFVRDPHGGSGGKGPVEDAAGMRAAGFQWVVFNTGDHDVGEYDVWVREAQRNGLAFGPWARCHTGEQVNELLDAAVSLAADLLVSNLEQEAGGPRWLLDALWTAERLAGVGVPVAVSTEPWLPDNFDWQAFASRGIACLPQAFAPNPIGDVIMRARETFSRVYPTCGAFAGNPTPAEYRDAIGVGRPFTVYAVDDVAAWEPWGW